MTNDYGTADLAPLERAPIAVDRRERAMQRLGLFQLRWIGLVFFGFLLLTSGSWASESPADDEASVDGVSICVSTPDDIRLLEGGVAKVVIRNDREESVRVYGSRQPQVDLPKLCADRRVPGVVSANWLIIRPGETWIGGVSLSPYTIGGFDGALGTHEVSFEIGLDFDRDITVDESVSLRAQFRISKGSQLATDLTAAQGRARELCWDDGRKAIGRVVDLRKVQIARKKEISAKLGLTLQTDSAGSNGIESENELQKALENDDVYRGVEEILRNRYGMDDLLRQKYLEKAKKIVADPNTYGQLEPTIVWGVDLTERAKSGYVPAKALLCCYEAAEHGRLAGLNCLDELEEEAAKCSERFFLRGIRDAMLVSEALQDGSEQDLTSTGARSAVP
jgi:hypothetical protein